MQRLLGLRSRYLAQRLLSALNPWRAGVSTAADFHALAQTVIDAPVERKLAFLFRLADADDSGRIDCEELERMVNIGLAENGVVLRREDEHRLLEAIIREADIGHDGLVDFDEFRRIIERRPALQARPPGISPGPSPADTPESKNTDAPRELVPFALKISGAVATSFGVAALAAMVAGLAVRSQIIKAADPLNVVKQQSNRTANSLRSRTPEMLRVK